MRASRFSLEWKSWLFVSHVPCQQIRHEHLGERTFPVNHFHHGLLIDAHHGGIGHCGRGAHAEGLSHEATLPEEITLIQKADCGLLPGLRHGGEFYLSFLYIKNRIGRIALSKDRLLSVKSCDLLPRSIVERNVLGSNLLRFLAAAATGVMMGLLSRVTNSEKVTSMKGQQMRKQGRTI
jgi:hypothetical protein